MTKKELKVQKALGTAIKYKIMISTNTSDIKPNLILLTGHIYHTEPDSALYDWWMNKDISKIIKKFNRGHRKSSTVWANVLYKNPVSGREHNLTYSHCGGSLHLDLYHDKRGLKLNPWEPWAMHVR